MKHSRAELDCPRLLTRQRLSRCWSTGVRVLWSWEA